VWPADNGDATQYRNGCQPAVTDDEFREIFLSNPHRALAELLERGTHLMQCEIAALVATQPTLWGGVSDEIDGRLQNASLKP
jgi:hypothetical protein